MKYIKSLLLLCSLGLLAVPASSQTKKSQSSAQYPLNLRSAFIFGCISDENDQSKPTEQQVRFCLCMLDRVQAKFTLNQFFTMAPALDNDKKRENALESFMEDQALECVFGN